jgi:hypothetical protein
VLVIHETAPASYGWATVASSNTNTMFDVVRDDPASVHPEVEGWIQRDLAVRLFKDAGLDFEALKKQAQTRDFKPVELRGETLSARYAVTRDVITSHNVAALLPGSTHPDETLLYSAHWDHLGVGKPDANGDPSSTAHSTTPAARRRCSSWRAASPRAQAGALGGVPRRHRRGERPARLEYYAGKPLYPLATTVAVINMDGMSPFVPSRDYGIYGTAKLGLLDDLKQVAGGWKLRYTRPEAGSRLVLRSDHFSFAKRGVPAMSYSAGQDWEVGGVAAGKAEEDDYVAHRYHQQADEWKPEWTFAGAARDLQVLYTLGMQLADSRRWPDRAATRSSAPSATRAPPSASEAFARGLRPRIVISDDGLPADHGQAVFVGARPRANVAAHAARQTDSAPPPGLDRQHAVQLGSRAKTGLLQPPHLRAARRGRWSACWGCRCSGTACRPGTAPGPAGRRRPASTTRRQCRNAAGRAARHRSRHRAARRWRRPRRAMMQLQAPAVLGRIRVGRPRVERAQPQHAVVLLEGDDARGAGIERAAK